MRNRDSNKEIKLRQTALDMIVKKGLDEFSIQKLARAAGVSPATIYIYYKDKEDLILSLYKEESQRMSEETMKNFDPMMPFSEGLRIQWMNRSRYIMEHKDKAIFIEQIRHSSLHEKVIGMVNETFKDKMGRFVHHAIERKELVKVPVEVYWSVAFAPLYSLVQFHQLGVNMAGNKFTLSEDIMNQTLEIVLKGLRP